MRKSKADQIINVLDNVGTTDDNANEGGNRARDSKKRGG